MLTNSPYVLAKHMIASKKFLTIKNIRIFLTYLIKTDLFNKYAILEFGRRIFLIILYSLRDQTSIEDTVRSFQEYPLDMDLPENFTGEHDESIPFFNSLWKRSEAFRKEKNKIR